MQRLHTFFTFAIAGIALTTSARPAFACGAFDSEARLRTTAETAILVYDETTREERFIRRASFATNPERHGQTVGFVVPTPSRPTLEEVDNSVFETLDYQLQMYLEDQSSKNGSSEGGGGCFGSGDLSDEAMGGAGAPRGVEVVEETRVAGQDATVLLASDPKALTEWLDAHGFTLEPAMRNYFDGYVEQGWYLTAFRYTPTSADDRLDTKAVSMRFSTPQAFYPYREAKTEAAPEGGRSLRIYALASGAQRADLGKNGELWRAERPWIAPLGPSVIEQLAPLGPLPKDVVVSTYEDFSNPRDGRDELWFTTDDIDATTPTNHPLAGVIASPVGLLALTSLLRRKRRDA